MAPDDMPLDAFARLSALADQDDARRPCDLCRTPTPAHLLRPEAYQEWDALCPACFRLATAHTALERAREAQQEEHPHA